MNWAGVARSRVRLARNVLRLGSQGAPPAVFSAVLGIAAALAVGSSLTFGFGWLAAAGAGPGETAGVLGLILTATMAALLVFDLQEVAESLLRDSDLDLLRRSPAPAWAIFVLKLGDAFPRTSWLIAILAFPAMVAFAIVHPIPLAAWLLVPPALIALWAIPLGLGATVAIAALQIVPARAARVVLGLVSTIALVVVWLLGVLLAPRMLDTTDPLTALRALAAGALWSPATWIAGMMAAAVEGDAIGALLRTLATLLAAALAVSFATATAAGGLESVRARLHATSAPRRRAPRVSRRSSAWAAILTRDLRLVSRDWPLVADVLVTSALWTLLPLVLLPQEQTLPAWLARVMLVALAVPLGFEVGSRVLPLERRAIAWARLAPVPPGRWVLARTAGVAMVTLPIVLVAIAAVAIALRTEPSGLITLIAGVVPALTLALASGLWTGAASANPEWRHARAMLTLPGRVLGLMLMLLQGAAWVGLSMLESAGILLPIADLAAMALSLAIVGRVARNLATRDAPG